MLHLQNPKQMAHPKQYLFPGGKLVVLTGDLVIQYKFIGRILSKLFWTNLYFLKKIIKKICPPPIQGLLSPEAALFQQLNMIPNTDL